MLVEHFEAVAVRNVGTLKLTLCEVEVKSKCQKIIMLKIIQLIGRSDLNCKVVDATWCQRTRKQNVFMIKPKLEQQIRSFFIK